jgi:hypothetical protein
VIGIQSRDEMSSVESYGKATKTVGTVAEDSVPQKRENPKGGTALREQSDVKRLKRKTHRVAMSPFRGATAFREEVASTEMSSVEGNQAV